MSNGEIKPTTHFKLEEFACKCCGQIRLNQEFLNRLEDARERAGIPFVITSGFRCEKHNKEVGSTSLNHVSGKAADVQCLTGWNRLIMVSSLIASGFKRIGIGKTIIHADTMASVSSIWLYDDI